jgi:hypothetical protein
VALDPFDPFDGGIDGPLESGGASFADMAATITCVASVSAELWFDDRKPVEAVSGGWSRGGYRAAEIIKAKLNSLVEKKRKTLEHAPVAIDSIAKQSEEFAKVEQKALVEKAVSEVLQMRSALDAEIKAEFAAIEIAQQLAVFEEEAIFMFLVASEA